MGISNTRESDRSVVSLSVWSRCWQFGGCNLHHIVNFILVKANVHVVIREHVTMSMSVVGQRALDREPYEDYVPATSYYGGSAFPTGCAGFVIGPPGQYHTLVCHECHIFGEDPDDAPVFADSEWDHPGGTCERCLRYLDTAILIYEKGPGDRLWDII